MSNVGLFLCLCLNRGRSSIKQQQQCNRKGDGDGKDDHGHGVWVFRVSGSVGSSLPLSRGLATEGNLPPLCGSARAFL